MHLTVFLTFNCTKIDIPHVFLYRSTETIKGISSWKHYEVNVDLTVDSVKIYQNVN